MKDVVIRDISKSFGDVSVLRGVTYRFDQGGIYCLMGPSGSGKTTLLRVLLGLETKDSGVIEGHHVGEISAMFQEDRLCETLTPVENIALVMSRKTKRSDIERMLTRILPADCMNRPAMQLSGGMRRRVSLARAVAFPSKMIILDEPFTGLDQATKKVVIEFLLEERKDRTLLISTHSEEDVVLVGGKKVLLDELFDR